MTADASGRHLFGYRLRAEQQEIVAYRGGRLAVAAVPGSGKTLTLSLLAARLILEGHIGAQGEVLVVTVQNSAVINIAQRIRTILQSQRVPAVGYRVCTLHKLAADILRRRQDLAGVDNDLIIVDDAETGRLISRALSTWLATNRVWWESFLPDPRGRSEEAWRRETEKIGREVIKLCKHLRLTPQRARELAEASAPDDGFLHLGIDLYELYAGYLRVRGGLDFDDLIWRAIDALDGDATFLERLRADWPYILEDEAQDSSPLQERTLAALAGPRGNWVRVGDTNQSINSTFTAADPRFFRRFIHAEGVTGLTLPQTGRCGRPIMRLANDLVRWTIAQHPEIAIREMAFDGYDMVPTEAGDAQPNPADDECWIGLPLSARRDEDDEAQYLADLAGRFIVKHPDRTCAVLCPTQALGAKVVKALAAIDPAVPYDDLLRSTPRAREAAGLLAAVFEYLSKPANSSALGRLLVALLEAGLLSAADAPSEVDRAALNRAALLVRAVTCERLLFPRDGASLRDLLPAGLGATDGEIALLVGFRAMAARWVRAAALPPDQLLLTVAQDLFEDEVSLAICHTLATSLSAMAEMHPEWHTQQYYEELDAIARNRRPLGSLSLTDAGYVDQPGTVVVTTMHKAKGLEWDTVFLMSVDSLEFPDRSDGAFRDGLWFLPGRAPAVEARKRLEQIAGAEFACPPEMSPIEASRLEYIAERLRLLYVGITRARRYLMLSYSERRGKRPVEPAGMLAVLRASHELQAEEGQP